jgi:hypothetical protein
MSAKEDDVTVVFYTPDGEEIRCAAEEALQKEEELLQKYEEITRQIVVPAK